MTLSPGTRLGAFEILALVGVGGMGEVYRARDTRLDRIVALKIVGAHETDAQVSHRLERFRQEARAVARITHPNICTLHDVCEEGGTTFLVMEFVEGTTLARRLEDGPLPVAAALKIAVQIADALDYAHRHGVVHRDLTPSNIMLARDRVKLLDFGLAKLKEPDERAAVLAATRTQLTDAHTIVGTAPYMAPEQIEGRDIDARTDIFAFGIVLYEMLAGKRPFGGDSRIALLAAITTAEPPSLSGFQPGTPPALERCVARCLAKDPDDRWQTARDLAAELRWIAEAGPGTVAARPATRVSRRAVVVSTAAILVALVAAGLFVARLRDTPATSPAVARFIVPPPDGGAIATEGAGRSPVAVSPDGRHIAFLAAMPGEPRQLYLRSLDGVTARLLPGTADAVSPFWSPDSRSIGFFARGTLQRISIAGGEPQTICEADGLGGATWNRDGVILFTPTFEGAAVHRVSAAGGIATPVTTRDAPESTHPSDLWPTFFPDGTHFMFGRIAGEASGLYVGSLDSSDVRLLLRIDPGTGDFPTPPAFAPPGYLLFVRRGVLMAQALDLQRLELAGDAFRVAEGIDNVGPWTAFSVSQNGVLVYWSRAFETTQLTWVDRSGRSTQTVGPQGAYAHIALSPDGTRVALDGNPPVAGMWVLDVVRGNLTRIASDIYAYSPVWSPDGDTVLYAVARDTPPNLFLRRLSAPGEAERLAHTPAQQFPMHWSPDGRSAVYVTLDSKTSMDLWLMPMTGDSPRPTPFLQAPGNEQNARISPDGRWIAYMSDESGRNEVYVTSFPRPGRRWLVSVNGGASPVWARNGRELYYLSTSDRSITAVPVSASPTFTAGLPEPLFPSQAVRAVGRGPGWPYDVAPDGRFLVNRLVESPSPPLTVVLNWLTDVRTR